MKNKIRLGTRGSQLALWQTNWVAERLKRNHPDIEFETIIIKTTGDKILDSPLSQIGDKGLFTRELDRALLDGRIDLAVHSMKDVPTEFDSALTMAVITERWDVRDALVSRNGRTLDQLPEGAVIATGSLRRRAQLLHYRPDLQVMDIRGNLQTRLQKFDGENWEGMILAVAGLERLGLHHRITQKIPVNIMLPAVGQGCFAVITRSGDTEVINFLQTIHQPETAAAVTAERALLRQLEGGCQVPLGAFGQVEEGTIRLQACVADLDGKLFFRDSISKPVAAAEAAGVELAGRLVNAGAGEVLKKIRDANA